MIIGSEIIFVNSFNADKNSHANIKTRILDVFESLKPSWLLNKIKGSNEADMSDYYVTEEQKEWFYSHLAKREELAGVVKKIYKIITLKKVFKFMLIMILLFFLPVFHSNGPDYVNYHERNGDYDIMSFFSEFCFNF